MKQLDSVLSLFDGRTYAGRERPNETGYRRRRSDMRSDMSRQRLLRRLPEISAATLRRLGDSKDPCRHLERLASRLEAIDLRYADFLLLAVAADSINGEPDPAAMGWLVPYLRRRGIKASRFHADIRRALRCDA
ncbi:MAG: hypothetical protein ACREP6_02650 [Candidatus Binataceae bacterium]